MTVPTRQLVDGHMIPSIGLGTYPMKGNDAVQAIVKALDLGYRLIDSAANYRNEEEVGRAVASSDVPRDEIIVTTKLPGRDHGYDETLRSFEESRQRLGLERVDLYLIHWPLPRIDKYVDSWRAMMKLRDDGLIRSIGVSNFTEAHLRRLEEETGELPAVNQIELHPKFVQPGLRAYGDARGIVTESWSPLGRATDLDDPTLVEIAATHEVSPSQVVLRWHLQLGAVPIPKSGDPGRQASNLDVFGFALEADEMQAVAAAGQERQGGDPEVHEEL